MFIPIQQLKLAQDISGTVTYQTPLKITITFLGMVSRPESQIKTKDVLRPKSENLNEDTDFNINVPLSYHLLQYSLLNQQVHQKQSIDA